MTNEAVGVELELRAERIRAVTDPTFRDRLITLSRQADGEVRYGHPGHEQIDRATPASETLAKDRHRIGQRREADVAVEGAGPRFRVTPGVAELGCAALATVATPRAVREPNEVDHAFPGFAVRASLERRRAEVGAGHELVVQPVRARTRAQLHPF